MPNQEMFGLVRSGIVTNGIRIDGDNPTLFLLTAMDLENFYRIDRYLEKNPDLEIIIRNPENDQLIELYTSKE